MMVGLQAFNQLIRWYGRARLVPQAGFTFNPILGSSFESVLALRMHCKVLSPQESEILDPAEFCRDILHRHHWLDSERSCSASSLDTSKRVGLGHPL